MSPSLTRFTGPMHIAPRNANACLLALWTLYHLQYFVVRQPASLISVMDPFRFPILCVIHKFRTGNNNTQAVLSTHAAGEIHYQGSFTQQQHFVRKLEKDFFGNEQTCILEYRMYLKYLYKIQDWVPSTETRRKLHKNTRFIQKYARYQHTS